MNSGICTLIHETILKVYLISPIFYFDPCLYWRYDFCGKYIRLCYSTLPWKFQVSTVKRLVSRKSLSMWGVTDQPSKNEIRGVIKFSIENRKIKAHNIHTVHRIDNVMVVWSVLPDSCQRIIVSFCVYSIGSHLINSPQLIF